MENSPIEIFKKWFSEELHLTGARIPSAVCLSTNGSDNFPNARFVSFKEIVNDSFIITGPLNSKKGIEINRNNHVALTFWWTETERQIRIQGKATKIPEKLADKYFAKRNRESQIVSKVSNQGEEVTDISMLHKAYQEMENINKNSALSRPKNWGGYFIEPIRIEFLEFKSTRFHDRKLFELKKGIWNMKQVQP